MLHRNRVAVGRLAFALFWLCWAQIAWAQQTPFALRAKELPAVLRGETKIDGYFAPYFLEHIPEAQIRKISGELAAQNGAISNDAIAEPASATSGTVKVNYERSIISFALTTEAAAPHRVIGLLVTSVAARDDSADKLIADTTKLPGVAGLLVRRLDATETPLIALNANRRMATGSSFKLWILAEAARTVAANERSWQQVIPLGRASLPSGITQDWPKSSPMTLHSLATFMISQSDNTASDTLLFALGREKVGRMAVASGATDTPDSLPVLSTLEAFVLKMEAEARLRDQWARGTLADRTRLLETFSSTADIDQIDRSQLAGQPRAIDTVEWFASPADLARTLNWLRVNGGPEAMSILAVNPGIAPGDAKRFAYVGYKGGSETGVIAMNLLVRTRANHWYAITGSWNNPDDAVDEARFVALVSRAAMLVADK